MGEANNRPAPRDSQDFLPLIDLSRRVAQAETRRLQQLVAQAQAKYVFPGLQFS